MEHHGVMGQPFQHDGKGGPLWILCPRLTKNNLPLETEEGFMVEGRELWLEAGEQGSRRRRELRPWAGQGTWNVGFKAFKFVGVPVDGGRQSRPGMVEAHFSGTRPGAFTPLSK